MPLVIECDSPRTGGAKVRVRGDLDLADIVRVAEADPLGKVALAAADAPDASVGDSLRLLAFYCDVKEGRR
jgi:hypothetical protein